MVAQAKAASQGKPTSYLATKDLPKGVVGNTEVIKAGTLVELTDTQFNNLTTNTNDPTIVTKPETMQVENFFLESTNNITSLRKIGTNFYDIEGNVVDFASDKYKNAFIVSPEVSYEIKQKETSKKKMRALVQSIGIDAGGVTVGTSLEKGGTTDRERDMFVKFSVPTGEESKTIVFDALAAAKEGTGVYNQFKSFVGEYVGGVFPPAAEYFQEATKAKNLISAIDILVRVALASSPRLAEMEQQRLAQITVDPNKFFTSPRSSLNKMVLIKKLLKKEQLASTNEYFLSASPEIKRQAEKSIFATMSALKLLETVPDQGFVDEEALGDTFDILEQSRKQRGR